MKKLISAGVDGIITDYPDRLVDLLRASQKAER
jgi:glycerophosphoryl diester phosphodiesterase